MNKQLQVSISILCLLTLDYSLLYSSSKTLKRYYLEHELIQKNSSSQKKNSPQKKETSGSEKKQNSQELGVSLTSWFSNQQHSYYTNLIKKTGIHKNLAQNISKILIYLYNNPAEINAAKHAIHTSIIEEKNNLIEQGNVTQAHDLEYNAYHEKGKLHKLLQNMIAQNKKHGSLSWLEMLKPTNIPISARILNNTLKMIIHNFLQTH